MLCLLAWSLVFPAAADPIIQFRSGQAIQCGGGPLGAATTYAIPCLADWNRDGRKDLLVGYQSLGKIAIYLNVGTDAQPIFTNWSNLKTNGGGDIQWISSGCGAPAPWVCDFDGDGNQDLLVGDGKTGNVLFYRNLNPSSNAVPILAPGVPLMVGIDALTVDSGGRATPFVCDWDEDGLPDLISGDYNGYVWFFRNTNTVQAPIFTPRVKLRAGGTDLCLGPGGSLGGVGRSVARVFDFDGDGLKDLVCSSDAGVYWCRNTNNNSNPILQAPVPIYVPAANHLIPMITGPVPGSRMRIDLADWNNDGSTDLILGDYSGKVYYFEGYRFALTGTARGLADQTVLQWNSASNLSYNILTGASPAGLMIKAVTNWPSGGSATRWTNTTAGNQQYYRVQIAP
jgi:hypothetical protein